MHQHVCKPDGAGVPATLKDEVGRVVLVLQGGGALGAYQAGVYEALHQAGIEPDWIIGTSIGAINASLIAGNAPGDRLAAFGEFWDRVAHRPLFNAREFNPLAQLAAYWSILCGGLQGFFTPNPFAFLGPHVPLGAEQAGYYSTSPLRSTLEDLVSFARINSGKMRLTVGAAELRTSRMRYFDTSSETLDVRHIMASGALPPAFPPVRIDGELYWDGGILSNTPTEIVFDDYPRFDSLIFAVHLWNPTGAEPQTMWDVLHRQKDVQYSSRVASHIARQQQMHKLRHVIEELAALIPPSELQREGVQEMVAQGCPTRMHIVRLLAPSLYHDDQTKDVDFDRQTIERRWRSGYEHTARALERMPWKGTFDKLAGVVLHEISEALA